MSCPDGLVDVLLAPEPPHAAIKLVRQSKSERRQRFAAGLWFALHLLAVSVCRLKRIEENLRTEFGGPSFEPLGSTVEEGSQEGQITGEHGPGHTGTLLTDDVLPGLEFQE